MSDQVELLAFLKQLRAEIEDSQKFLSESGKDPMFQLEKVELEAKVLVAKDTSVEAGIKLYCVSLGGGGKIKGEEVHSLKLTLSGRKVWVAEEPD